MIAAAGLDHDAAVGYLSLGLLKVKHIAQPVDQRLERQGIEGNQQIPGALAPVGVVRPFRRIGIDHHLDMGAALPQDGGQMFPAAGDAGVGGLVVGKDDIHLVGLDVRNGLLRGLHVLHHPEALKHMEHDHQFRTQPLVAVHQQDFHLHRRFLPFYSACPTALNASSSALALPS